jgi:hypothetical protein
MTDKKMDMALERAQSLKAFRASWKLSTVRNPARIPEVEFE